MSSHLDLLRLDNLSFIWSYSLFLITEAPAFLFTNEGKPTSSLLHLFTWKKMLSNIIPKDGSVLGETSFI